MKKIITVILCILLTVGTVGGTIALTKHLTENERNEAPMDEFTSKNDNESSDNSGDVENSSSMQTECVHKYGEEPTSVIAATCTSKGQEVYKCTKCGEEKTAELSMVDHVLETFKAKPATCTESGYLSYAVCSNCSKRFLWEEIPALGHDYEGGVCTRCNEQDPDYVVSEGLAYTLNDDGESYAVGIGTCTDTDIIIPSTYEGKPVAYIAADGFANCVNLTSVVLPNTLTTIKDNGFLGCTGLTNVVIPDSVTSVGRSAFGNCSNLRNVTIGNGVTVIAGLMFQDCSSLTSVTIGNSVETIGVQAFENCTSLTSITIPDSVTSIWGGAFHGCSSLTSVTFENTIGWTNMGSTNIASSDLENPSTAAEYVTVTYLGGMRRSSTEEVMDEESSATGIEVCLPLEDAPGCMFSLNRFNEDMDWYLSGTEDFSNESEWTVYY